MNDCVFKPGQVWNYDTRAGEENSTIIIMGFTQGKGDLIVHVILRDITLVVNNGNKIINQICFVPISYPSLLRSVTNLKETLDIIVDYSTVIDVDLSINPQLTQIQSHLLGYQEWLKTEKLQYYANTTIKELVMLFDNKTNTFENVTVKYFEY
jgi:hypothetical protein